MHATFLIVISQFLIISHFSWLVVSLFMVPPRGPLTIGSDFPSFADGQQFAPRKSQHAAGNSQARYETNPFLAC